MIDWDYKHRKDIKMDRVFAKKWVKALRSGKYKQAHDVLFNGEGYCCLGVACIVAGKKFVHKVEANDYVVERTKEYAHLPSSVKKLMKIKYVTGEFTDKDGGLGSLTDMNDSGKTFEEIADFIENNYERL